MANVNQFIGSLQGGGARPNQFKVTFPALGSDFEFLCRSAQIPALTIGEVLIPFRGRQVYVPGDRTYDPWAVTVMNDRSYAIRSTLEAWMNDLQDIGSSTVSNAIGAEVYRQVTVEQLDRNDRKIRTYTLYDAWPTTLDAIDLAFDTNDTLEEFTVTFRFNYMTAAGTGLTSTHQRTVSDTMYAASGANLGTTDA
jgi:hypothetical protein